jgi:carboxyl-terminal processing protease
VPLRNMLILLFATTICIACAVQARNMRYGSKIGQAIGLVDDYYIKQVDPDELYIAAMEGIVSKLDQFSAFIPPQNYQEFQSSIEQHFGGIGVTIEGPPAVKRLTVVSPIPRTPAFKAGLQAGDVILEIDGQSTEGLESAQATKLMRGEIGTSVKLLVRRMDSSECVELVVPRADIEVNSVYGDHIREDSSWDYFLEEDSRIAYIRINMFGERTVNEFRQALHEVRSQAKAIVIDLRFNPGGILPSSVEMCDMLLDRGVIVKTKGRKPVFDHDFTADANLELATSIPIAVLINGDSASAAEIMAGCLQDNSRAVVVGSRTYGKGTVQQVFELESDTSALKFTTARFLRPSGKNIHRDEKMNSGDEWGIQPDSGLDLPMTPIEQIYLNRRWNMRGDPRSVLRGDRPPEPAFAGDMQLEAAVNYLQRQLGDEANSKNLPTTSASPPADPTEYAQPASEPQP